MPGTVRGVAVAGADLRLSWAEPQPVAAVVLAGIDLPREGLTASVDGAAPRERPAMRHGLQWLNGAPRAGGPAVVVSVQGGRALREIVVRAPAPWPAAVAAQAYGAGTN